MPETGLIRFVRRRVLVVDDNLSEPHTAHGRAVGAIVDALRQAGVTVVEATTLDDGLAAVEENAALHCAFVNWDYGDPTDQIQIRELIDKITARHEDIPLFLMLERRAYLPNEVRHKAAEVVALLQDTPGFIAGRAEAAIEDFLERLVPPFTAALLTYNHEREYSWAAPGHQGGVAFTKSTVGRMFHDFYGENLFRTDTGIERPALGSLLDHSGVIAESERYIASVFGADHSYSAVTGTSGANRIIMQASVAEGQVALCDRNCHKSIEQGLAITGAVPVYLVPSRNRYGVIGPIPQRHLTAPGVRAAVAASPLVRAAHIDAATARLRYAVVTNSTYDGLCYDTDAVLQTLGSQVETLHFDEAWYSYARFHPLYEGRFALPGEPPGPETRRLGPTIFATQSTHKGLAALSQASMIHVRYGERGFEHHRFNEAYMMHSTTSPLYAILASNEVAAAMMEGEEGTALTTETIAEAVDFRIDLTNTYEAEAGWFFTPWNAPDVVHPRTGDRVPFHRVPAELLVREPDVWVLHPGETWHGFAELPDGYCMLDPVKVGVLCPGVADDGSLEEWGIPGKLVSRYLFERGIVLSRATDHMILLLFTIGATRGKSGTVVSALLDFKKAYEDNVALKAVMPDLVEKHVLRYHNARLRDLSDEMWRHLRATGPGDALQATFDSLPVAEETPRVAFQRLMSGDVELVPLTHAHGRRSAVAVIPYPPGIPVIMPGESFGAPGSPVLRYLDALVSWDAAFPGFETEISGTVLGVAEDGTWQRFVYCAR